jgi:mono/diheme cytochrome c family protein
VIRTAAAALALSAVACGGAQPRGPMSDGRRMYLAKCTSCHAEYAPSKYTPEQWQAALDEMEKQKRIHLSADERALILSYLTSGR